MADDRKKMLEALVAKRKAESRSFDRAKKPKAPSFPSKHADKSHGEKPKLKPSSFAVKKKEKESPKKKKRVEKYESEGSDEEDADSYSSESEGDSEDDSGVETLKKSKNVPKASKGKTPPKGEAKGGSKLNPPAGYGKGKELAKGKPAVKVKDKGKKKHHGSGDEELSGEDDGGDLSEDSNDEVDASNIIQSRTRRRASQPVQYDFGDLSDDDDSDA